MKNLSIGTGAFIRGPYAGRPVPFDDCLARIVALGFRGIELGARSPHPSPESLDTLEKRAEFRRRIADRGLSLTGLSIDFRGQSPLQEDASAYLDQFDANLAFAADLGIRTLRVDTVIAPEAVAPREERAVAERAAATWKQAAQRAADRGVRVVWEFEPCFAINKPGQILDVLRGVDEPNFGVLFDTCHAHTVAAVGARQMGEKETLPGGALEFLSLVQGWIGAIHVIDTDGSLGDGETSAHLPIGAGRLDFDALVPALLDAGAPTDWWCIDLCGCPSAWEAIEPCKVALEGYLSKYDRGS